MDIPPEVGDIVHTQKLKLEKSRVPVEFVRPVEKVDSVAALPSNTEIFPEELPVAHSTPLLTASVGGGLLAGIDDLLGDKKSKRNRCVLV